jgi:hypothetical protein
MIRRAIVLLSLAGIYVWMTRHRDPNIRRKQEDHAAEAEWANEGGQNSPTSV